jgi:hypothetical protein
MQLSITSQTISGCRAYPRLLLPFQVRFHSGRPGLTGKLTDDLAIVIILWQENVDTLAVTVNPGR